jgi:hypothetical protein
MEFKNLTPFQAIAYTGVDTQDREYHVVAMAVGYRLLRDDDGQWRAELIEDDSLSLCMADEHYGEPVSSSIRRESDLIPYKPRCDVVVRGSSHAPEGRPAKQWTARLMLTTAKRETIPEPEPPEPLNPVMGLTTAQREAWARTLDAHRRKVEQAQSAPPRTVLDKTLRVSGPSVFERTPLLGYRRGAITAVAAVPLRWEHAWGGGCRVDALEPKARDKTNETTDEALPPLLNEVCFSNPVGCGWIEKRWASAMKKADRPLPKTLPAPQIEYLHDPALSSPLEFKHPAGEQDARAMKRIAEGYGRKPAGFGPLCKAWAPRLALAGTYDDVWLEERHPFLPKDFDFGYWNGAPADQQIAFPDLTEGYELLTDNLVPGGGSMRVALPRHRALALADLGGAHLPFPMQIDTMLLDTEAMTLTLVWRTALLKLAEPDTVEARFIVDPEAPWVKYAPIDDTDNNTTSEATPPLTTVATGDNA